MIETNLSANRCIAISGASGLVGSELRRLLEADGHRVIALGRSGESVRWNPQQGVLDPSALEGVDAVVHLAGENIAGGRWTATRKGAIRESRVEGTRALIDSLSKLSRPPRDFLCASAIGFYGDRGDESLDESSAPGEGFLADVCVAWEEAANAASELDCRVAKLRMGVVLAWNGGALQRMLLPFKLGLGGKVGSGSQVMSWIALDDLVSAIRFVLLSDELEGPINLTAPNPVANAELTAELGRILRRPTILPLPTIMAKTLLGEMADELLLSSAKVLPRRLLESGFRFAHPQLRSALEALLRA